MNKPISYMKWAAYIGIILAFANVMMYFCMDYAKITMDFYVEGNGVIPFSGIFTGEGFTSVLIDSLEIEGTVDVYDSSTLEKLLVIAFWVGIILLFVGAFMTLKNIKKSIAEEWSKISGAIVLYIGGVATFLGAIGLYMIIEKAKEEVEDSLGMMNMFLGIDIQTDMLTVVIVNGIAVAAVVFLAYYYNKAMKKNHLEQQEKN